MVKKTHFDSPLRVLVVEDNKVDQTILEAMITESPEYNSFLKVVPTLKEALNLLNEFEFDVIVLDLNLPDSQGIETLICVNEQYPHVAIVVNTGAFEDDIGLQSLSQGAQDFLIKGKGTAYGLNKALHYAVERKRLDLELIEKTQKLTDVQSHLIEAEKMKVVGGLASGVAHEVKNPLATIHYGITYLKEKYKGDDEKILEALDTIKESTDRANKIIIDLLDFASLSQLDRKEEDLNTIVEKSLSLVKYNIEQKKIKLIKQLRPNIPTVKIDRYRIEQVIINLILNSVHAMDSGGEIKLKTTIEAVNDKFKHPLISRNGFKPGDQLLFLTIEDVGCGINPEDLKNIFNPFYTTRRAGGGVGLGLSVSKNIVENHDGDIYLENRKEGGARATLVLKI